mgnify:CR=1 FL=1
MGNLTCPLSSVHTCPLSVSRSALIGLRLLWYNSTSVHAKLRIKVTRYKKVNGKDCFKKYLKYGLKNIQIFSSLGASEGFAEHVDDGDILIICLEGEIAYTIEGMKPVVLNAGDTIYIKEGLVHGGISSTVPRICLSCEVQESIPKEDVTYYFGSRYRTKN